MPKRLLVTLAAALIAICFAGLASAQAPSAAPTGVTVLSSGEGFVISWDSSDADSHWVAWMSNDDYETARANGDWTTALQYDPVPSGNTHVVSSDRLVPGKDYWIVVGSVSGASAVSWGAWQQAATLPGAPEPEPTDDDALTRAYVMAAIAYYEANGREATIAGYNDPGSVAGERVLYLIDTETLVIVASPIRQVRGFKLTEGTLLVDELKKATEQGHFFENLWINVATGQQEPTRFLMVLHDGLVFASAHLIVKENVADTTQEYVNRAIKHYDDHGLDAMVAHYNTRASFDGQLYLFMMDENDVYLVHPFIPRLIGTDIKDLPNQDLEGNPLGVEIAKATAGRHLGGIPVAQSRNVQG